MRELALQIEMNKKYGPQSLGPSYSAFHKTFDKRFPKFVLNSRSSLRTEQFHYVVVNQNFETKL